MQSNNYFANSKTAQILVRRLYPDAKNVTVVEHSYDNIVVLVDEKYTIRFPRDKNAYARSQHEATVLSQIGHIEDIKIPQILAQHTQPPCLITTFVSGHHIKSSDIRLFPKAKQQNFARTVARFAYIMHTSFSLQTELQLRKSLKLDELEDGEPWAIYFDKIIKMQRLQNTLQNKIALEQYTKWLDLCNVEPQVVVHDDLHTENIMFSNSGIMTGVLDFGDTNVGTPEQELRQLYRVSEEVLLAGVEEYQTLSGRILNLEAIKTWSILKELADYSSKLTSHETGHNSFKRTSNNLNNWLPEGRWGEGFDLSGDQGCQ